MGLNIFWTWLEMSNRYPEMKSRVMEEMRQAFRPEFLNRIDEVIIFHSLRQEQLRVIVKLLLAQNLQKRLAERKITLKLSDAALDFLAEIGFDPVYGARPLKRAIQKELETQLAKSILRSEFGENDTIFVDIENERLSFNRLTEEMLSVR